MVAWHILTHQGNAMTVVFRGPGPEIWRTVVDLLWGACLTHKNPRNCALSTVVTPSSHLFSTNPTCSPVLGWARASLGIWNCVPRELQAFHGREAVRWKQGHCGWPYFSRLKQREGETDRQTEKADPQREAETGRTHHRFLVDTPPTSLDLVLPGTWLPSLC